MTKNLDYQISIIVPFFNAEKFIIRALESLKNQSIKVKVIIVDDGSDDNSAFLVQEFIKKHNLIHFQYFYKENGGISDARNFGLKYVETEFFGFLDADDTVNQDIYFKMLLKIIETNANICMCDFDWVYPFKRRRSIDTNYQNIKEIITKMYATLWNKIYRTVWFKQSNLQFPKGLKYEDASVLYRLAPLMDKVCYVSESLVNYYQNANSITHTFKSNVLDMIAVFKEIKSHYLTYHPEYLKELEYVSIRFFLGNNFLRACQIQDDKLRKETLGLGYQFLKDHFKDFKKNLYLRNFSFKNLYFLMINDYSYNISAFIFSVFYKLK